MRLACRAAALREFRITAAAPANLRQLGSPNFVFSLQPLKLRAETQQLVARAESLESIKLVTASFRNRSPQELRALASQLQNEVSVVALLASYDGAKLSLVIACASDTRISANDLIRKQLAETGGRGGGDAKLAQGGGAANEQQFAAVFGKTREYVRALKGT